MLLSIEVVTYLESFIVQVPYDHRIVHSINGKEDRDHEFQGPLVLP